MTWRCTPLRDGTPEAEEALHLCHPLRLNVAIEGKDHALPVCHSLDLQHRCCFPDPSPVSVMAQDAGQA